ncbi:MAG: ribonuclease P protein component [Bacteroidales bacterium]|jgi:ribonuclease P protein component|nr:ribonuclease P protein component [Bacteroidales bacterium]
MLPEKDNHIDLSFPKKNRISSEKVIQELIGNKKVIFEHPFKCFYHCTPILDPHEGNAICVSVPKKIFKRAVDRNRVKRLIRESYRINNHTILDENTLLKEQKLELMIIYIEKTILPYKLIELKIKELLNKVILKIS